MKAGILWILFALNTVAVADIPAEACRINDESFFGEEGGCLHFRTGTVWSHQPVGTLKCSDAAQYCRSLDQGGFRDWSLPTRGTLQALASSTAYSNQLNIRRAAFFWAAGNTDSERAWAVSLADAEIAFLEASARGSVVCTRTPPDVDGDGVPDSSDRCNQTPPRSRRSPENAEVHTTGEWKGCLAGDSIISAAEVRRIGCATEGAYFRTEGGGCRHVATGLTWSSSPPTQLNINQAQSYCSDLVEGLKNDWRLPTSDELVRLAGALRTAPSFKISTNRFFWSTSMSQNRYASGGYIYNNFNQVAIHLSTAQAAHDRIYTERNYVTNPVDATYTAAPTPERAVICVRP